MKDESRAFIANFGLHTSAFLLHTSLWRRSQVVRQRSAKPLFIGSIPIAASNNSSQQQHIQPGRDGPLSGSGRHVAGSVATLYHSHVRNHSSRECMVLGES